MSALDSPVVIIGAARSGTTLLGNTLKQHPELCYVEEPNYIWRYGKYSLKTDYFDRRSLSEADAEYIRKWFCRKLAGALGAKRILEKTPANSLRVAYVNEVLPDALFIHLVRDGRDVASSAKSKWISRSDRNKVRIPGEDGRFADILKQWEKVKQMPVCDVVLNFTDLFEHFLHKAIGTRLRVWGPRFPGIYDYVKQTPEIEVCALQWLHSVEFAERDLKMVDSSRVLELRYENFIQSPRETMDRICCFAGLDNYDFDLNHIDNSLGLKSPADIGEDALRHISEKLKSLGYII